MKQTTEVQVALEAVRAAAKLTQAVRASTRPGSLQKGDRSPVTVADYGSQAVVCRTLTARFPDLPIIAEESATALRKPENATLLEQVTAFVRQVVPGAESDDVLDWIDQGSETQVFERFWTLDPIDGTKGFLRGDQYAIALALVENGSPVVAALACPALPDRETRSDGTILIAAAGEGSYGIRTGTDESYPIAVSKNADPALARLSESVESGHSSHRDSARIASTLGIRTEPRRLDSQAKYAVVARGEADAYMRLPVRIGRDERIWDHAAGALVVTEAGGRVTDIYGQDLDFSYGACLTHNTGVVATNGHLHEVVLEALSREGIAD